MTQYTIPKNEEASDMFWDACQGGYSSWVHCDCGTEWTPPVHSATEDENYEDYEDHRDWFRYVELEGRTFVEQCEECCKKLGRYEQWIWNNRSTVRDYLFIRVEQQFKWAEQEKMLNEITGIDKRRKYL